MKTQLNHLLTGILIAILFPFLGVAQAPFAFNYQGLAQDNTGTAFAEKEIALRISIVESSDEGSIEFIEEHVLTTAKSGLFSLRIGQGIPILGNLRNINWGEFPYFIRVEIDPEGGVNYTELGTSQLYSVPYALYAANAGNSEGGGGGSDEQSLSINGNILTIENGNSVALPISEAGSDEQTLSLNQNVLSIENGNSVTLPSNGGGNDADADPFNELQSLSISGNTLSISQSNSITLPVSQGAANSPWKEENDHIFYDGTVFVGGDRFSAPIDLSKGSDNEGTMILYKQENDIVFPSVRLDGIFGLSGFRPNGDFTHHIGQNSNGDGVMTIYNDDSLMVANFSYDDRSGGGSYYGQNGEINVLITSQVSNPNYGAIGVANEKGDFKAQLTIDGNGNGIVLADDCVSFVENPEKSGSHISYSMLQGPGSTIYLRGTGQLIDGIASVELPAHFSNSADPKGITIILTPLSGKSKGLAVVKKGNSQFRVEELLDGSGNYDFDWEVKAYKLKSKKYNHSILKATLAKSLMKIPSIKKQ